MGISVLELQIPHMRTPDMLQQGFVRYGVTLGVVRCVE
jgi:outer membrane usher protein FimD/PapC